MTNAKIAAAAVGGLLVASALIGLSAASASAATLLCNENKTPCPNEKTYPAFTRIFAKLKAGTVTNFEAGGFKVKCEESEVEGKTMQEAGVPLEGKVTSLNFAKCNGGMFCGANAPKAINLAYLALTEAEGAGNGETLVEEGEGGGPPGAIFECALGVKCTYAAGAIPFLWFGGAPATLVVNNVALFRVAGPEAFCPFEARWRAEYTVFAPNPVFVI